jgi:hypothetical protein
MAADLAREDPFSRSRTTRGTGLSERLTGMMTNDRFLRLGERSTQGHVGRRVPLIVQPPLGGGIAGPRPTFEDLSDFGECIAI